MADILALSIDQYAIYTLRCAAEEWLQEHPDNLNAPAVRDALLKTDYLNARRRENR